MYVNVGLEYELAKDRIWEGLVISPIVIMVLGDVCVRVFVS